MDKALAELIRISNTTGKDTTLVQGGGGNTSVKTGDGKYMYIKASGTALKDLNEKQGWRRLRLDAVMSIMNDKTLLAMEAQSREAEVVNRLLLACNDNVTVAARPSVEAHIHAFLDKCVIHLHPNTVGAYVNAKNGFAELQKLFKNEKFPPLWVPYTDPGFTLAKKIAALVKDYQNMFGRKPAILFLEKHGLFVSAKTSNTALKIVRRVITICDTKTKSLKAGKIRFPDSDAVTSAKLCIRGAIFQATGKYVSISHHYDEQIAAFLRLKNAKKLLSAPSLTPDELVYSNGPAMWVENCNTKKIASCISRQIEKGMKPSAGFLVKGLGLFMAGKKTIATTIREVTATSLFIRYNASGFGGISALNKRQQDFINKWEAESFRKKLLAGSDEGALTDRIAFVTGAGSGLGKSIAVGLARAGAIVVIADIDTDSAEKTICSIKEELPAAQVISVLCDVTKEKSVDDAFNTVLENYGGLDILVNAAGVAPAAALIDMDVKKFRFALEVNLTGYLLCARAAARIMKAQRMGGAIVNISSKSGLEASKNNSAYNATKAGELHMARGWSLELGEYGIRVNSVCPGNVFEGSKIWNAKYINECAKKYNIKPEEVIPFYVNKTCLRREIKGSDIADSVVFLCSDNARTITGQSLVADSGQVMVR